MSPPVAIARVASDLAAGRWERLRLKRQAAFISEGDAPGWAPAHHSTEWSEEKTDRIIRNAVETVVDVQGVYEQTATRGVRLYEDATYIAPPWRSALLCYVNRYENVIALAIEGLDRPEGERPEEWPAPEDHPIDWPRVRWVIDCVAAVGGRSAVEHRPVPTCAPAMAYRLAVYEDGTAADLSWVQTDARYPPVRWDIDLAIVVQALNLANCKNVELVEPERPRAERRRIERTGVVVRTLAVRPVGRYRPDAERRRGDGFVPLTTVRGHPVHYGACCPNHEPRGLLFGRITGRFWIPAHARGDARAGVRVNDYRVEPSTRG